MPIDKDKMVHVDVTLLLPEPSTEIGFPAIIDMGPPGRTSGLRVVVFSRAQAEVIFGSTLSARLQSVVCVDIPRAVLCTNLIQAMEFYDGN